MNVVPVSSSDIASVGYEYDTLYIKFNSGGVYAYYNVPVEIYNNLMCVSSKGKYFHAHIKSLYPYRRIG